MSSIRTALKLGLIRERKIVLNVEKNLVEKTYVLFSYHLVTKGILVRGGESVKVK